MEKIFQFFLFLVVLAISACTFDSAGLNTHNDCIGVDCGHGICVKLPDQPAECQCETNWQGEQCNECVLVYTGPDCSECADGYAKNEMDLCVPVISSCEPNPCVHGVCVDLGDQQICCECGEGYDGLLCDTCAEGYEPDDNGECVLIIVDPCSFLDCGEHGTCIVNQQSQSAICDCDTGYRGDLCEQCDELNGYEFVEDECQLNPCFNRNCGAGTCVLNAQTWTASCECDPEAFGDACQYWYANTLIYQESVVRLRIQVRNAQWLDATGTFRVNQTGTVSGAGIIYYTQIDILTGGWLAFRPCLPGVDEKISFFISKAPYGVTERMKIEYLPPLNPVDPDGFIYDSSSEPNMDIFQVECYDCAHGCKVRAAGGTP